MRQLCVHRDMKHLGSLESTQEARVDLGYASSNSNASFVFLNFPRTSYLDEHSLTHESIVFYKHFFQLIFRIRFYL